MEALSVDVIPEGGDWQYEPKWDGFRCVAFRDGGSMAIADLPHLRFKRVGHNAQRNQNRFV